MQVVTYVNTSSSRRAEGQIQEYCDPVQSPSLVVKNAQHPDAAAAVLLYNDQILKHFEIALILLWQTLLSLWV